MSVKVLQTDSRPANYEAAMAQVERETGEKPISAAHYANEILVFTEKATYALRPKGESMKPIYFEPPPEAPECPQEPRPPRLGWRLNAGLKTLLRASLAATASLWTWWGTDPASLQLVAALVPARYVWLFAALVVVSGWAHNHIAHRPPQ